jgi:hypothetical protein
MADQTDPEVLASQLTTTIVAARVGAAAGRPTGAEGEEAAQYYRAMLAEVRRGLGLPGVDAE